MKTRRGMYILVIHYRHDKRPDEFFYLTKAQITRHRLKGSEWGDLIFNKPERETYREQNLSRLAREILGGKL